MVDDVVKNLGYINVGGLDDEEEELFFGKWYVVLKMLVIFKYMLVFFIVWFMGFGIGLIFIFLFWYF